MHPVLFKFHSLTIYSYGLCVALAVVASLWLSLWLAPKRGLSASTAVDLLFIVFVAGVIGARAFYVLQHLDEYRGRWLHAFWLREGGLVWYGGFLLAVLSGIVYCRRHYQSVLAWPDFFAPILAFAHGVGRIGCFMNGCCYGKDGHPVQLYEAAGLFALSGLLFRAASKKPRDGSVISWYLLLYAALRFCLEFLRADQTLHFGLSVPQWMSLGLFGLGLGFLGALRSGHENQR